MIPLESLLLYVPMAALFVMLPGPDFALIAKISLLEGRPQGQAAACGVALGIGVHTTAAMLGISAVIAHSAFWFSVLKYVGAAYLVWLGVKALRHGGATGAAAARTAAEGVAPPRAVKLTFRQWRRCFAQGFLTNALNPKAVILFLTFLPQFMDPAAPLGPQFLTLGGIMSGLCLVWYVPLAYMLGRIRRLFASDRFQTRLQRCTGVIFIAFGLKLATAHAR
ncbi:MAG: LysE family translocator [Desulfovibrio desulfuricans]|jgi:threonine/homoserine/homoserine lactone efflux protein|nr:LysE family translocator [Desulfovibrio desulfuricans]